MKTLKSIWWETVLAFLLFTLTTLANAGQFGGSQPIVADLGFSVKDDNLIMYGGEGLLFGGAATAMKMAFDDPRTGNPKLDWVPSVFLSGVSIYINCPFLGCDAETVKNFFLQEGFEIGGAWLIPFGIVPLFDPKKGQVSLALKF